MLAYACYLNDARIKAYVKSLESAGMDVDVLAVGEENKPMLERHGRTRVLHLTTKYTGGTAFYYLWSYFQFYVVSSITLTLLALRHRYAVVHVHNMPNLLVFAAIVPKLLGAKIILDVHDLMPANYMAKFHVNEQHWAVKLLILEQRVAAFAAWHVLCADHSQQEFLQGVCRIPTRKLTVMLNLPNEEIFKRQDRPRCGDRFELVYHGTIAWRLGIDIMLSAVAQVDKNIPLRLSIFGNGEFLDDALRMSSEHGLNGRVSFSRSFFPVEKIPELVGGMDLGIIGNRRTLACDKYMLPVKLLEYVYLGVPVVAPRLEVIKRYFAEDMLKFYEPENTTDLTRCIVELYHSPNERRQLAANASRFYVTYNWRSQVKTYLDLVSARTE